MAEIKLTAEVRDEFGKGAARRIRRAHKVPAVLYGHGSDPVHITLPGHETLLALRQQNALLSIDIAGDSQLALPKQVQRDPLRGSIEHVDLLLVRRGEKVTVEIQINLTGEHHPDALIVLETNQISVEAEATHIPNEIEVSIEGLAPGTQVLAKDVALPEGARLVSDEDQLIVNVTQAPSQAMVEAELAEAEAEVGIEATVDESAEDETAEGETDADADAAQGEDKPADE